MAPAASLKDYCGGFEHELGQHQDASRVRQRSHGPSDMKRRRARQPSLLANAPTGIGYGIAGCLLPWAAEGQMGR
jgi:hypothetical protein